MFVFSYTALLPFSLYFVHRRRRHLPLKPFAVEVDPNDAQERVLEVAFVSAPLTQPLLLSLPAYHGATISRDQCSLATLATEPVQSVSELVSQGIRPIFTSHLLLS